MLKNQLLMSELSDLDNDLGQGLPIVSKFSCNTCCSQKSYQWMGQNLDSGSKRTSSMFLTRQNQCLGQVQTTLALTKLLKINI